MNYSRVYFYYIRVKFRECKRGEIYKQKDNICSRCEYGSFSFEPSIEKCQDCPANAICTGSEILAMPNFWRETINSTKLFECNVLKEACPGGEFKNICNKGYRGPLCGSCVFNKDEKYFKNTFMVCKECSDGINPLGLLISLFILIILVVVVVFTIRTSFNLEKKQNKSMLTILNCILINYMQILSLLTNIEISWPSLVDSGSQMVDFAGDLDRIVGVFECPFAEIGLTHEVSVYSVKVAAGTTFFIFFFVITFSFWGAYSFLKKAPVKNKIIISIISIYLLTLQPMIKFYTKNFHCIDINGRSYLKYYPYLECNVIYSIEKNALIVFFYFFIAKEFFYKFLQ